jgi:alkyl sulfatase BDS1-like metallo-beta-lactamase superfamily hydrolase
MGGSEAVLMRARVDFAAGEVRWVAEALNHVVFAEPANRAARDLAADAMEQLGYQAESATWRNSYLLAARELRGRATAAAPRGVAISPDVVAVLPLGSFLEYLAIRLNGEKAQSLSARIDWRLRDDTGIESQRITLSNGALNHLPGSHGALAGAIVETTRQQLGRVSAGRAALLAGIDSGDLQIDGDRALVRALFELLDEFDPMFNVVEP